MQTAKLLLTSAILAVLTACGGSGSVNSPANTPAPNAPKNNDTGRQNPNNQQNQPNASRPQTNNNIVPPNNGGGNHQQPPNNGGGNNQQPPNNPQPKALELKGLNAVEKSISPIAKVEGAGNKLTVTINGDNVSVEALRAAAPNGAPTFNKDYIKEKSYKTFAVSGEQYKHQVFGFLYDKSNGQGGKGDDRAYAFSAGALTLLDDAILKPATKDSLKYKGDSYIGDRYTGLVKGTSEFDVSFFDKKIKGTLKFKNAPQLDPGFGGVKTNFPENISLAGDVNGNTFKANGSAKIPFRPENRVTAEGQFYGEGAKELGGVFIIDDQGKTSGSFGAIKQ